jgi:hypothetical protein
MRFSHLSMSGDRSICGPVQRSTAKLVKMGPVQCRECDVLDQFPGRAVRDRTRSSHLSMSGAIDRSRGPVQRSAAKLVKMGPVQRRECDVLDQFPGRAVRARPSRLDNGHNSTHVPARHGSPRKICRNDTPVLFRSGGWFQDSRRAANHLRICLQARRLGRRCDPERTPRKKQQPVGTSTARRAREGHRRPSRAQCAVECSSDAHGCLPVSVSLVASGARASTRARPASPPRHPNRQLTGPSPNAGGWTHGSPEAPHLCRLVGRSRLTPARSSIVTRSAAQPSCRAVHCQRPPASSSRAASARDRCPCRTCTLTSAVSGVGWKT